jgi:hypothetical protein
MPEHFHYNSSEHDDHNYCQPAGDTCAKRNRFPPPPKRRKTREKFGVKFLWHNDYIRDQ